MGGMTGVGQRGLLNYIFRNTSIGLDASNLYVALFTVTPTDSTNGTEITGGGYARAAVSRTGAGFDAATGTSPATTSNTSAITFVRASADWGLVTGFGFCLSIAGALSTDLFYFGSLATATFVANGTAFSFPIGDIDATQTTQT